LKECLIFPIQYDRRTSPYPWEPKFLPKEWVDTDGFDITGPPPRLGAAVVHIPTITTIYIDAAGTEETRTITRAEMVAIHTALTTFSTHDRLGIFTDSLSSLQTTRHHYTDPGTTIAKHYHHHKLLMDSITDLIETRKLSGIRTTLHKIRAHTNIRGNDLADAAAKRAVTHYDTLPPLQTRRVETGETAPSPNYWVMYSAELPPPLPALATGTSCATLHCPWLTIMEEECLQMYAFTRPSSQLRLKVRDALIRSLHHSSLYRRVIVSSKEKGARTKTVGQALHKKLTRSPWKGTSLLKFIYGSP
jgi:ribonuclease HI